MSIEITVPKLSATMEEAKVLRWLKQPGDAVREGELLVELETDKAALEVEATASGTLSERKVNEGDTVAVGSVIAVLSASGEPAAPAAAAPAVASKNSAPEPKRAPRLEDASYAATPPKPANGANGAMPGLRRPAATPARAVKASPLARRIARERGFGLDTLRGTGPNGRVMRRDVESYQPAARPAPAATTPAPATNAEGLSKMRQAIAAQVSESRRTIPSFTLDRWVELELLEEARDLFNRKLERQNQQRLTVTDLVLQAMADVLPKHPKLLARWVDGNPPRVEQASGAAVGLVVALDDGLMIPVLSGLDGKGAEAIAAQRREAVASARGGRLGSAFAGKATISLSNIGKLGVDRFEAVISPGETAILAVGRVAEQPVARNGALTVARGAHFTLSVDHRLIDGLTGAAFLADLADRIERQTWRL
jgi:pyruvate dehydrogenase E2 component (dihydrolipoamide acetyltransferase)